MSTLEGTPELATTTADSLVGFAVLGKTAAALIAVVLTMMALAWLLKRFQAHLQGNAKSSMKIVSTLSLSQRERVVIIDVHGEKMVLGVTAQHINLLKTLDNPGPASSPNSPSDSPSFNEVYGAIK